MFGLLLPGRLVETGFRQVDSSHVVAEVEDPESAHHLVVFLTGQQPFPEGMGGAVYMAWPQQQQQQQVGQQQEHDWQFLGALSNDKPSAIFRISRPKAAQESSVVVNGVQSSDLVARFGGLGNGAQQQPQQQQLKPPAQLGISMEPLSQLSGLSGRAPDAVDSEVRAAAAVPAFLDFSRKMCESLFNYSASFAVTPEQIVAQRQQQMGGAGADATYVPFSTLRTWYANFERRLQQNPNFWKS